MVYEWKTMSHIKADANVAGQQCEELERTIGLTPSNLLDASREENAPLHDAFEWNDGIAAEQYRLAQARHIINCLCVKQDTRAQDKPQVRAFFKMVSTATYESISIIVKDEEKYAEMLERAYQELQAFKNKYQTLTELQAIFDMIDKVTSEDKNE